MSWLVGDSDEMRQSYLSIGPKGLNEEHDGQER